MIPKMVFRGKIYAGNETSQRNSIATIKGLITAHYKYLYIYYVVLKVVYIEIA